MGLTSAERTNSSIVRRFPPVAFPNRKYESCPSCPRMYRIHPAIGIARVGNHPDEFFVGPEVPGRPASPLTNDEDLKDLEELAGISRDMSFKSGGMIKRQAARFHIIEYVKVASSMPPHHGHWIPTREITSRDATIEWTVKLANVKGTCKGRNGSLVYNRNDEAITTGANPIKISGRNSSIEARTGPSPVTSLGRLLTDAKGRLLVLGGDGLAKKGPNAQSIGNFLSNQGWYDTTSDGPVKATIQFHTEQNQILPGEGNNESTPEVLPAWVLVGPPDFAPSIRNIVTLYDVLVDLAAKAPKAPSAGAQALTPGSSLTYEAESPHSVIWEIHGIRRFAPNSGANKFSFLGNEDYKVSFADDVWPILKSALDYALVTDVAREANSKNPVHKSSGKLRQNLAQDNVGTPEGKKFRSDIFDRVRPPPERRSSATNKATMPILYGDDYGVDINSRLSITSYQYAMLEKWHAGHFYDVLDGTNMGDALDSDVSPRGLDQAALENCVGGAFCPGIEVSIRIREARFIEPFRIKPSTYYAGYFTEPLAQPWQGDFFDCQRGTAGAAWWPAQRPDNFWTEVNGLKEWHRGAESKGEMTEKWHMLGFVLGDDGQEQERSFPSSESRASK